MQGCPAETNGGEHCATAEAAVPCPALFEAGQCGEQRRGLSQQGEFNSLPLETLHTVRSVRNSRTLRKQSQSWWQCRLLSRQVEKRRYTGWTFTLILGLFSSGEERWPAIVFPWCLWGPRGRSLLKFHSLSPRGLQFACCFLYIWVLAPLSAPSAFVEYLFASLPSCGWRQRNIRERNSGNGEADHSWW